MTTARARTGGSHRARAETARSRTVGRRTTGTKATRNGSGGAKRGRAATASRAPRHRRPELRLVRPPRPRRLPFVIASFLIVGTLVLGVASVQAVVSQGSFRMQELTKRNVELEEDYGRLKLQVAELSAPGRIAAEARRLGFHVPGSVSALPVKGAAPVNGGGGAGTLGRPVFTLKGVLEHGP
jgi:cell division protein FtsL